MSTLVSFIIWIALGAIAGWIASMIMGSSLSLLWCIIIGIVGSVLGGWLAGIIGIGGGWVVQLLIAVVGACLLLLIARLIRRAA